MSLIVQKFGGTSLYDVACIQRAAKRVEEAISRGYAVIVVVSARAGVTDQLIARAHEVNPHPSLQELDALLAIGEQETSALMAMALEAIGVPAVSRTGAQAGIFTNAEHTRAKILQVEKGDIREQLDAGRVVIVAGFQGVTEFGQATTLGRGGSDLTAIALAAAMQAERCEIFTDVDGVYTGDPRVVPTAGKIDLLDYASMYVMASSGGKVMQPRAVALAEQSGVSFSVRSSFLQDEGTLITQSIENYENTVICGVLSEKNHSLITLEGLRPGALSQIILQLSQASLSIHEFTYTMDSASRVYLNFGVEDTDAEKVLLRVLQIPGCSHSASRKKVAFLSVIGTGVASDPKVIEKILGVLDAWQVRPMAMMGSPMKLSLALPMEVIDGVTRAVHDALGLRVFLPL